MISRVSIYLLCCASLVITACTSNPVATDSHSKIVDADQVSSAMTQSQLEITIRGVAHEVSAEDNILTISYRGITLYCISDPDADRMRIFSPIVSYNQLAEEHKLKMFMANFHTALDARYTVSNGVVNAAFIHPLSSLDEAFVKSALNQVSNLALSFGSEYSSGQLSFGAQQ